MSEQFFEQLKHEKITWLRSLDFLQVENIMLKNRLAEILRLNVSNEILDKLEHYQNIFLSKDAVISILRHDIKEHKKGLQNSLAINDKNDPLFQRQQLLRSDMEKMEKEFSRLKAEFNNYLAQCCD